MKGDLPVETGELRIPPADETAGRRRAAVTLLLIALVAILVLYRETLQAMVSIWARSDTFAHGFLVAPILLWLIWRARASFAGLVPRPCYGTLILLAGAGFAWLLGEMATVAPLSQFAVIAMLVLAVPAILGTDIARRIAFPLGFLFFAVPFGEFTMPQLMEWTANVTILGLRLTGIPVYREGLHFIIPSGAWSVVEACSGVRYLIASLMVGTLFAYLTYRSLKRRLIFVGVSFVVPILANWARAYMIVMLGHLSGNRLAAGVDHLIYGWVFFGIVIMAMFWIGARWREDGDAPAAAPSPAPVAVRRPLPVLPAVVALMLLVAFWPFAEWMIERGKPADVSAIASLQAVPGWTPSDEALTDWEPRFDKASAYLHKSFIADGQTVGLYMAYYRNQGPERKLVTSTNALVTSDDRRWIKVTSGGRSVAADGQAVEVRTTELSGQNGQRLAVWQWYWVGGRLTRSDHVAKAFTALHRLLGQGDDSAVVIVYAPAETGSAAVLERFCVAAVPAITQALEHTRSGR